jgi:hypothetical protein
MDNLDLNLRNLFKQVSESNKDLFDEALTLSKLNQAIYAMGDHLRQSLLTYSRLSTKNQIKG